MSSNGLSELNSRVIAGKDYPIIGCHAEVAPFRFASMLVAYYSTEAMSAAMLPTLVTRLRQRWAAHSIGSSTRPWLSRIWPPWRVCRRCTSPHGFELLPDYVKRITSQSPARWRQDRSVPDL